MKCPNCGNKMPDGKLFCENCGEEINIVPDYDPNSDLTIDLNGVFDRTKEINTAEVKRKKRISGYVPNEDSYDDSFDEDDDYDDDDSGDVSDIKDLIYGFVDFWNKSVFSKIVVFIGFLIVILAIVGVVFLISTFTKKNTYEHYIEEGNAYYEDGEFDKAIESYEKALKKNPDLINAKYSISNAYLAMDQDSNAVFMLKEIAEEYPDKERDAYDKIFQILYDNKDWAGINDILENCDNAEIVDKFREYLCKKPDFSEEEGTYDESMYLEISGSTNGLIYYTLDGSDPTETSFLYSEPIFLESGEYDIKAIFISEFGVISDVNEGKYIIDVKIPLAPMVSINSGSYNVPILISVISDVNCKTYYNVKRPTDKEELQDPDYDSTEYSGPLPMPLGSSEFRFISYNEEGIPSTVITKKYNVKIDESVVSLEVAANIATQFRFDQGGLRDTEGHSATGNGRFLYIIEDAINMKGTVYYVINEYYEDPSANKTSFTGKRIAVNSTNGDDHGWLELNAAGEYFINRPQLVQSLTQSITINY